MELHWVNKDSKFDYLNLAQFSGKSFRRFVCLLLNLYIYKCIYIYLPEKLDKLFLGFRFYCKIFFDN